MKCVHCGKGLEEVRALHRQNQKGEAPIWACDDCTMVPTDRVIEDVVNAINPRETPNPPIKH